MVESGEESALRQHRWSHSDKTTMANPPAPAPSSFWTQANALLRKNLTFQKRNVKTNILLILFPVILLSFLAVGQHYIDKKFKMAEVKCSCLCPDGASDCPDSEKLCGTKYYNPIQILACAIPSPTEWPPLLQLPSQASWPGSDPSCRSNHSCPLIFLFTANNRSFGQGVSRHMFPTALKVDESDIMASFATNVLGSENFLADTYFLDDAFSMSPRPVSYLLTDCSQDIGVSFPYQKAGFLVGQEFVCGQGLNLWRESSSEINNELFRCYQGENPETNINGVVSAIDFLNSNRNIFNVTIWYNSSTLQTDDSGPSLLSGLKRIPRSVNLISNAYLQFLLGPNANMLFEFVKEMPKSERTVTTTLDVASLLGGLFYAFVVMQLFPVVLTSLVYEKQQKLRIMMKMHGLGDGPYLMITYGYFLAISMIYMFSFVIFGSVTGLKFFTLNDYSIQFVFYFIYINLQISLAFLAASIFSNATTATMTAYIGVFGTGLLSEFLFQNFVQSTSFPRGWIIFMELYPGFALFRGLYEFAQSSAIGSYMGSDGMRWGDLSDSANGMKEVLIIVLAEWVVVLFAAYCIDQVLSSSSGKGPLFFLKGFQRKPPSFQKPSVQRQGSKVKPDVIQEMEKVEQLLLEPAINHAIVCDNLKKVYPGRDGNPDKFAVRGLFLAVPRGECFGMLGPNGAGKSSFISMMTGLTKPTSGTASVHGLDILTQMDGVYTSMGVCPQHDLLWECLTGREHLLFYGRLKNLKGFVLTQAVEESLKSLNLFHGGVADKQAGKYSGGMKRRLSVAISLIGNPRVVYMDEPSTGLDPASRKSLWNVVKLAKRNRAIILTTHSMEEAEALCDRLGIFVNGSLQCVGNPKELKGRYGGTYVFTMTTSSDHEREVENLVMKLTPNANKIYHLSGTQKFELPKEDVRIADVFQAVEAAKKNFTVSAWGLADTTLEDVFIKVAREAQAFDTLA